MFAITQAESQDVLDAFNTEALKLAAMGVTITVSSGDNGAASDPDLCLEPSGSADYGYWEVCVAVADFTVTVLY